MILGMTASAACFFSVGIVKCKPEIDDSLGVFAVHGLGSIIGTLLIPFLAHGILDGEGVMVAGRSVFT
jgi:Amt family ammonium transporter